MLAGARSSRWLNRWPDVEQRNTNPEAAPALPRPPGLTPVRDYMDASAQAVPDAVLVLFLADLPVAHPDPVALLEKLPGGLLPPPGVGQRLGLDPSIRAPVH